MIARRLAAPLPQRRSHHASSTCSAWTIAHPC